MHYQFTAKSATGALQRGQLLAASVAEVQQLLRGRGLFAVSIQPLGKKGLAPENAMPRATRRKVSQRDLLTVTTQLAIMSRAGIDFAGAVQNLGEQCTNATLRDVLKQIHDDVMSGKPVSQAMATHEAIFGRSYIAGIAAAEMSGKLPEVLDRLSSLLRSEMRMRGTLRGMLTYPIVLTTVSLLVVAGLMFFVLPQFANVFAQMEIPLPAVTQALISCASEMRARWWLWGIVCAAAAAGATSFVMSPAGRKLLDDWMIRAVWIRDVTRALLIGRAFRLLSTMLGSGVPLLDAIRLTRSSIRNRTFQGFFDLLDQELINGRGISAAFLSAAFVPPAAAQMIATAERTGTLATVMELMGEFYEEEGETKLRELATIIEPMIIVVMGVVVAVVVMSVMLPMFDFATAAK